MRMLGGSQVFVEEEVMVPVMSPRNHHLKDKDGPEKTPRDCLLDDHGGTFQGTIVNAGSDDRVLPAAGRYTVIRQASG